VGKLQVNLFLQRVVVSLLQGLDKHLRGVVPAGFDVAAASPVLLIDVLTNPIEKFAVGD
jgi:hypothetical protein